MKAPALIFINDRCWFVGNVAVDIEMWYGFGRLELFTTYFPGRMTFETFREIRDWV